MSSKHSHPSKRHRHPSTITTTTISRKKLQFLKNSIRSTPWYDAMDLLNVGNGLLTALQLFPMMTMTATTTTTTTSSSSSASISTTTTPTTSEIIIDNKKNVHGLCARTTTSASANTVGEELSCRSHDDDDDDDDDEKIKTRIRKNNTNNTNNHHLSSFPPARETSCDCCCCCSGNKSLLERQQSQHHQQQVLRPVMEVEQSSSSFLRIPPQLPMALHRVALWKGSNRRYYGTSSSRTINGGGGGGGEWTAGGGSNNSMNTNGGSTTTTLPHAMESTACLASLLYMDATMTSSNSSSNSCRRCCCCCRSSSNHSITDTTTKSTIITIHQLRNAYSSAIIRSVNGLADSYRRVHSSSSSSSANPTSSSPPSISYCACTLAGLPSWIVDVRHDATHSGTLPSLYICRLASLELLRYWKLKYWNKIEESIWGGERKGGSSSTTSKYPEKEEDEEEEDDDATTKNVNRNIKGGRGGGGDCYGIYTQAYDILTKYQSLAVLEWNSANLISEEGSNSSSSNNNNNNNGGSGGNGQRAQQCHDSRKEQQQQQQQQHPTTQRSSETKSHHNPESARTNMTATSIILLPPPLLGQSGGVDVDSNVRNNINVDDDDDNDMIIVPLFFERVDPDTSSTTTGNKDYTIYDDTRATESQGISHDDNVLTRTKDTPSNNHRRHRSISSRSEESYCTRNPWWILAQDNEPTTNKKKKKRKMKEKIPNESEDHVAYPAPAAIPDTNAAAAVATATNEIPLRLNATKSSAAGKSIISSSSKTDCAREFIRTIPMDIAFSTCLQFLVWGWEKNPGRESYSCSSTATPIVGSNNNIVMGVVVNGRNCHDPALVTLPSDFVVNCNRRNRTETAEKNERWINQEGIGEAYEEEDVELESIFDQLRTMYEPLLIAMTTAYPGFSPALFVHLIDSILCLEKAAEKGIIHREVQLDCHIQYLSRWIRYILSRDFHMHFDRSVAVFASKERSHSEHQCQEDWKDPTAGAVERSLKQGKMEEGSLSQAQNSVDLKKRGRKKWNTSQRRFMQSPLDYPSLHNFGFPLNSACDRLLLFQQQRNTSRVMHLYQYLQYAIGEKDRITCIGMCTGETCCSGSGSMLHDIRGTTLEIENEDKEINRKKCRLAKPFEAEGNILSLEDMEMMLCGDECKSATQGEAVLAHSIDNVEAKEGKNHKTVSPWTLCKTWDACAIGIMPGYPS